MSIIKSIVYIALVIKHKLFKTKKITDIVSFEKKCPHSYNLQRRLAILVSNIDNIDNKDLMHVKCRKTGVGQSDDLFTAFRVDFSNKDYLEKFKKKYKSYLL